MKTFKEYITEGSKIKIEVEFMADNKSELSDEEIKMFKDRKIKVHFKKGDYADLSGNKKDIIDYLTDKEFYDLDLEEVKDSYPDLFEK